MARAMEWICWRFFCIVSFPEGEKGFETEEDTGFFEKKGDELIFFQNKIKWLGERAEKNHTP